MSRRMTPEEKEGRRLIREAFWVLPLEAWRRTAWWVVDRYGYTSPSDDGDRPPLKEQT